MCSDQAAEQCVLVALSPSPNSAAEAVQPRVCSQNPLSSALAPEKPQKLLAVSGAGPQKWLADQAAAQVGGRASAARRPPHQAANNKP